MDTCTVWVFPSLREANKVWVRLFLVYNNLLLEGIGLHVIKRTVGFMAFRRALSINLGWFNNRTETSFDEGWARGKDYTRLPVPNLALCHCSSELFELRAPPSTDVPVLLQNQPFCYQEPFWLLFICVCLLVVLIQGNFDTPGDTTRSDTNWFSRGDSTTDISRHMLFLFTRDNYASGLITIFLQFHCLGSYGNDSFPLQLIDQITFFLSRQMCHVN